MHARDVMTTKLVTIGETATVREAATLMSENDVSALPVVDEQGRLVGLLSEADLLHRKEIGTQLVRPWWLEAVTPASTLAAEFLQAHGTAARELMSKKVVSAAPSAPLSEIAALMERHRVKRIPIVEDGRLIGIVSRSNLVQALASAPPSVGKTIEQDRVIRAELLSRLAQQRWTDFGDRNVTVSDGIVHIWGLVGSPAEREALAALAAEVPGVKRVADEMFPAY